MLAGGARYRRGRGDGRRCGKAMQLRSAGGPSVRYKKQKKGVGKLTRAPEGTRARCYVRTYLETSFKVGLPFADAACAFDSETRTYARVASSACAFSMFQGGR